MATTTAAAAAATTAGLRSAPLFDPRSCARALAAAARRSWRRSLSGMWRRRHAKIAAHVRHNGSQLVRGGLFGAARADEVGAVGIVVERHAVFVGYEIDVIGELQHVSVEWQLGPDAGTQRSQVGARRRQVVERVSKLSSPIVLRHTQWCSLQHRQLLFEPTQALLQGLQPRLEKGSVI